MTDIQERLASRADNAAFRKVYSEFAPAVKAYLIHTGNGADLAEDLTRKALISAWQLLSIAPSSDRTAGADIFAIARNIRLERQNHTFVWQERAQTQRFLDQDVSSNAGVISARLRHLIAQQVVADVPAENFELLKFIYIDGLSIAQIALRTNHSIEDVRGRLRETCELIKTKYKALRASQANR